MLECPEPLATFFQNMLPAARHEGYKLVVTLLAREADSESIFRDVERYWTSLHDVTGKHVLFVLGANGAASKFQYHGMADRTESLRHSSPHISVAGDPTLHWPYSFTKWQNSSLGKGQPTPYLAQSHSLEITALRSLIGLSEQDIPAVLLIPLRSNRPIDDMIVVSLSGIKNTIYLLLKLMMEHAESQFVELDDIRSERHRFNETSRQLDNMRKTRWTLRHWMPSSIPDNVREASYEVLALCRTPGRGTSERKRCFEILKEISEVAGRHADISRALRSFIDTSFHDTRISREFQLNQRARWEADTAELESNRARIDSREYAIWNDLYTFLRGVPKNVEGNQERNWDFFIAYSAKDEWIAGRLFDELSKQWKVFIDRRCLRPGDVWPQRLREEQERSNCTVLLVSQNMSDSWFSRSEYIHAIDLARHGNHRIVPILMGSEMKPPYGLEQVHCVRWHDTWKLPELVQQLAALG